MYVIRIAQSLLDHTVDQFGITLREELRCWADQRGLFLELGIPRRYEQVLSFPHTGWGRAIQFVCPSDELRHGEDLHRWLDGYTSISASIAIRRGLRKRGYEPGTTNRLQMWERL